MNAIANVSIFIGMITIIVVYIKTGRKNSMVGAQPKLWTIRYLVLTLQSIFGLVEEWVLLLAMLFLTLLEKSRTY